jgi:hypothetical protein
MKPPNSYNGYNRLYTNHASKSSKGDGDIIDKMFQTVTELQEKEHKVKTITDYYHRYPDAPKLIPNVDSDNLPIKNMLEQSFPKILCKNGRNNNPSPQMQGHNNRNETASQNTGGNGSLVAFPSHNKDGDPQSIQPVPINNNDDNDSDNDDKCYAIKIVKKDDVDDRGFKITWTIKYNCLGDIMDAYVTDGLYTYLSERERRLEKRVQENSSS